MTDDEKRTDDLFAGRVAPTLEEAYRMGLALQRAGAPTTPLTALLVAGYVAEFVAALGVMAVSGVAASAATFAMTAPYDAYVNYGASEGFDAAKIERYRATAVLLGVIEAVRLAEAWSSLGDDVRGLNEERVSLLIQQLHEIGGHEYLCEAIAIAWREECEWPEIVRVCGLLYGWAIRHVPLRLGLWVPCPLLDVPDIAVDQPEHETLARMQAMIQAELQAKVRATVAEGGGHKAIGKRLIAMTSAGMVTNGRAARRRFEREAERLARSAGVAAEKAVAEWDRTDTPIDRERQRETAAYHKRGSDA